MTIDIVANLTVHDGEAAVVFYQRAFGAVVRFRIDGPNGAEFAELGIGDARIFVAQESHRFRNFSPAHLGGTTVRIDLLVDDPDAVHAGAVAAGATEISPVREEEVGPRMGVVDDPFGHRWLIGAHWSGARS